MLYNGSEVIAVEKRMWMRIAKEGKPYNLQIDCGCYPGLDRILEAVGMTPNVGKWEFYWGGR